MRSLTTDNTLNVRTNTFSLCFHWLRSSIMIEQRVERRWRPHLTNVIWQAMLDFLSEHILS